MRPDERDNKRQSSAEKAKVLEDSRRVMKEIWKDIKGFEGKYQVSNMGRIKSLKYLKKNETNSST